MSMGEQIDSMLPGERLMLRRGRAGDVEALTALLTEPEVARWWGVWDTQRARNELGRGFVVVIDGASVGWLEFLEETDPDYRHVSFDIALTTALHGRGYGREALRVVIRHFIGRGHHRFTIDPAVDNDRAIRAYRAVGFGPVGVMRAYERAGDGTWHDNLLMDLLAAEFDG